FGGAKLEAADVRILIARLAPAVIEVAKVELAFELNRELAIGRREKEVPVAVAAGDAVIQPGGAGFAVGQDITDKVLDLGGAGLGHPRLLALMLQRRDLGRKRLDLPRKRIQIDGRRNAFSRAG